MLKCISFVALSVSLWGQTQAAVPTAPKLIAPTPNQGSIPINTTLYWDTTGHGGDTATSFNVEYSVNSGFTNPKVIQTGIHNENLNIGPLLYNTKYFWHVSGTNTSGTGAYSTLDSFTTTQGAPGKVALAKPANLAINQTRKTVLVWRKLATATSYHLQVATAETFATATVRDIASIIDTTYTLPDSLAASTKYYWRVSASNLGGNGLDSAIWSFTTVPAKPVLPTLISPAAAATQLPRPIVFLWHKAERAAAYRFQISTVNSFLSRVIDTVITTGDTTISIATLNYGTDYYWRIRSGNPGDTSLFTEFRTFSTLQKPLPPALVDVPNNALNQPLSLKLVWHKSARAVNYRIQVSTDEAFTGTLFLNDSTLTDTTRMIGPLANKTAYFWRTTAKNAAGISAFSDVRKFTTIALLSPPIPTLVSPKDTASGLSTSPVLKWNPALRAVTYTLQVSTTTTFGTLVFQDSTLKDTTKSVGPLKNDELYYWRVSAKNATGTSLYSEIRSFSTQEGKAAEPVLLSPSDSETNVPRALSLVWKKAQNASLYQLQVSTHADLTSPTINDSSLTDTSFNVTSLTYGTVYFWRVRSMNDAGKSEYTASRKFTVVIEGPVGPILLSPSDTAKDQARSLTFKWSAVAKATSYQFQLSATTTFSSLVTNDSTLTDTSKTVSELNAGTTYFWRVRAKNAGGISSYSEIHSFQTKAAVGMVSNRASKQIGFTVSTGHVGNQSMVLEYSVIGNEWVNISLVNPANGRSTQVLDTRVEAGSYRLTLGSQLSEKGMVFIRMTAGTYKQTQKIFVP
jgi:hypothetical protein